MGFKEYLNESLIVETKVKVAGREFPSKKDAGLFLAGQGKTADQIERMTGLSAAGAKWCIGQVSRSHIKIDKNDPRNEMIKIKDAMTKAKTNKERGILKAKETIMHSYNDKAWTYPQILLSNHLKKVTGNKDVYFDGEDLVVGDKTVLRGALDKRKDFDTQDLIDAIRKGNKNKAQERREALDAYKKGEKYKPEPLELAPLDKEKSKSNAKEWMKKHGDDHLKKKRT